MHVVRKQGQHRLITGTRARTLPGVVASKLSLESQVGRRRDGVPAGASESEHREAWLVHSYEEAPSPGNLGSCLKHRKDSRKVLLKGLSRAVPRPALCFERSLLATWTLVWGEGRWARLALRDPSHLEGEPFLTGMPEAGRHWPRVPLGL